MPKPNDMNEEFEDLPEDLPESPEEFEEAPRKGAPQKGKKGQKPGGSFLKGRGLAVIIIVLIASGSFALGFIVGRAAAPEKVVTKTVEKQVSVPCPPCPEASDCPEPKAATTKPITKTEASKPKPTAKKAAPKKPYFSVQAGAFESYADAERLRKSLNSKGYKSFILRDSTKGRKPSYKVRVGEYNEEGEARLLSVKLKSQEGIAAFVVKGD